MKAAEASAYFREEADFNRSWTDGRRSAAPFREGGDSDGYKARRIELALERERWADAIDALRARCEALEEAFPEPRFGKRARRPAVARGATRSEARRGTSPT